MFTFESTPGEASKAEEPKKEQEKPEKKATPDMEKRNMTREIASRVARQLEQKGDEASKLAAKALREAIVASARLEIKPASTGTAATEGLSDLLSMTIASTGGLKPELGHWYEQTGLQTRVEDTKKAAIAAAIAAAAAPAAAAPAPAPAAATTAPAPAPAAAPEAKEAGHQKKLDEYYASVSAGMEANHGYKKRYDFLWTGLNTGKTELKTLEKAHADRMRYTMDSETKVHQKEKDLQVIIDDIAKLTIKVTDSNRQFLQDERIRIQSELDVAKADNVLKGKAQMEAFGKVETKQNEIKVIEVQLNELEQLVTLLPYPTKPETADEDSA